MALKEYTRPCHHIVEHLMWWVGQVMICLLSSRRNMTLQWSSSFLGQTAWLFSLWINIPMWKMKAPPSWAWRFLLSQPMSLLLCISLCEWRMCLDMSLQPRQVNFIGMICTCSQSFFCISDLEPWKILVKVMGSGFSYEPEKLGLNLWNQDSHSIDLMFRTN